MWQKTLGGTASDEAYAITASGDGGFVVAGFTNSTDGDVSGNHGGNADYWVVKLDKDGQKVWQKTLGGSYTDVATAITASGDGGFVVAGYTQSNDGDVSGNQGDIDYWVVKLDKDGAKVWQKTLGGTASDVANAITASGDGGFVVAGYTYSNDGDVSGNQGTYDYWVVKLDKDGAKVWQKALGGTSGDVVRAITASGDGGFVVAGYTQSNDGDVSGVHGGIIDAWVVKLDKDGQKVWQKALGGTSVDQANAITASPDGGYVVAGVTGSTDGDVSGVHGGGDYWVVKLDKDGAKVWQKTLGGTASDEATAIVPNGNGGFVVAGFTNSNDGDVNGTHGDIDYWVVQLDSPAPFNLTASPNPVCVGQPLQFTATIGGLTSPYTYTLTNGTSINQVGTSSSSAFSQSITASGSGLQSFTLLVGTPSGVGSATVSVTVNALPNAGFSGLGTSYCANAGAVTLTPITSGGSFSGPGVSGNTFTPAQAGAGGTVSYSLTVNGCTNSSAQPVTVNALPNAGLANNGPLSDTNPTVTLTASGGTSYSFSSGATPISTGLATVNTPGPYSVTVTQNGCSSVASTTVTGAQNPPTVCRNGTAVIKVVPGGNPVKYEWFKNSITSARLTESPNNQKGTNTASLTLVNQQVTTNFYVRVTDANGSSVVYGPIKLTVNGSCNALVNGRLGAEEVALQITLLGNPIQGEQLRAIVQGAGGKALTVQLLDVSGRPLRQQVWPQAQTEQPVEWSLGNQASGVYLLQATTEANASSPIQRHSLKVIKP